MRKLFTAIAAIATLGLAACEASVSLDGVKSNMTNGGYTVTVRNEAETKEEIKGINYNVTVNNSLFATKGDKDALVVFFCNNIDDASSFVRENVQAMYYWAARYSEAPVTGNHNNAAYAGSKAAVKQAGFPVSD